MNIALHINSADSFLIAAVQLWSGQDTDDLFIVFTPYEIADLPQSCTQIFVSPKEPGKLFSLFWYNYKLASLLKKNNAAVFLSDAKILSMKTAVPQYLYLNDEITHLKNSLATKQFRKSLAKATAIFVAEDFILHEVISVEGTAAEKIIVAYPAINSPRGAAVVSAGLIKEKFTYGVDYFIYKVDATSAPYLVTLLKSFSKFKNRQKSSMQLVLLADENMDTEELIPDFKNYKFRTEVKIVSVSEKNALSLLQHGYALIWFCRYRPQSDAFVAMHSQVPVIALANAANENLFSTAALYAPADETALSEKMQLLYKDEGMRKNIIENANALLKRYDGTVSANTIWQKISVGIPLKKIPE